MSGSTAVYDMLMPPVMIGMKADSMYDNVDSYPAFGDIGFGRVCFFAGTGNTVNARKVRVGIAVPQPPAQGPPAGIALQDHVVGAYGPHYREHDAVSVLTRGRVWAEVSVAADEGAPGAIVPGAQVSFRGTTGRVCHPGAPAGTSTPQPLPHAIFRSGIVQVPPIWPSGLLGGGSVALVELNVPPYQPITTVP